MLQQRIITGLSELGTEPIDGKKAFFFLKKFISVHKLEKSTLCHKINKIKSYQPVFNVLYAVVYSALPSDKWYI